MLAKLQMQQGLFIKLNRHKDAAIRTSVVISQKIARKSSRTSLESWKVGVSAEEQKLLTVFLWLWM